MSTQTAPPRAAAWVLARHITGLEAPDANGTVSGEWKAIAAEVARADPTQRATVLQVELARRGMDVNATFRAIAETRAEDPMPSERPGVKRYTIHNADEALSEIPPLEWVVDGIFLKGSVSAIVGEGGSKKTFTMVDCCVCVALGKPWLQFATHQGTVLIIDEESGANRLKRRLSAAMRGHGALAGTPIYFTTLEQFNFRDVADVGHVERLVDEVQPVLVVIDALIDVMPGGDDNLARDTQPVFQALRKIADRKQVAVSVIHHANRNGGYRGSSAIKGAVDLMLMVTSSPASSRIDVTTEKARDIEPVSFSAVARFDKDTDTVKLDPSTTTVRGIHYSKSEDYVIRHLTSHGAATMEEIANHADACTPNAARKAVYALVSKKVLCRSDDGGPGVKASYDLITARSPYADD